MKILMILLRGFLSTVHHFSLFFWPLDARLFLSSPYTNLRGHGLSTTSCFFLWKAIRTAKMVATNYFPFLSFLLTIATTTVTISAYEFCSNAEMEHVRVEHSKCTSKIRHAFLPTAISVQQNLKNVEDVCKIVNDTVFGCGKVYEKCYDDEGAK